MTTRKKKKTSDSMCQFKLQFNCGGMELTATMFVNCILGGNMNLKTLNRNGGSVAKNYIEIKIYFLLSE